MLCLDMFWDMLELLHDIVAIQNGNVPFPFAFCETRCTRIFRPRSELWPPGVVAAKAAMAQQENSSMLAAM